MLDDAIAEAPAPRPHEAPETDAVGGRSPPRWPQTAARTRTGAGGAVGPEGLKPGGRPPLLLLVGVTHLMGWVLHQSSASLPAWTGRRGSLP